MCRCFKLVGNHYSHFYRGIAHFDDGRTVPLDSCIHTATYERDSIFIDDVNHIEECRFPLRWFVKDGALDFYGIGSDAPDILFHNESSKNIRIDKFGILKSGESLDVYMNKREHN